MPPLLDALWIADCASASQLDEVLEEIDCVEPMLDSAPALAATDGLPDDDVEDDDAAEDDEELARFAHAVVKTEETDMPTTASPKQSPQFLLSGRDG
jgi:hypothetical protein